MRAYERAYQLRKFRSLPCHLVVSSIYPRLFALHQLAADEGEYVTMFDCNSPETSIHTPTQPGSFWTGMKLDIYCRLNDGCKLIVYNQATRHRKVAA